MKKFFSVLLTSVITMLFSIYPVFAGELFSLSHTDSMISSAVTSDTEIVPYADTIIYKYRYYNGVLQYRRWNETKECWVDPDWIAFG